jgi:hypothetical protein
MVEASMLAVEVVVVQPWVEPGGMSDRLLPRLPQRTLAHGYPSALAVGEYTEYRAQWLADSMR